MIRVDYGSLLIDVVAKLVHAILYTQLTTISFVISSTFDCSIVRSRDLGDFSKIALVLSR